MKLIIPERENLQPGSRTGTPQSIDLAMAPGRAFGAFGAELAKTATEVTERKAQAKRDALVTERVSRARVDYAAWFDERSKDPELHESLAGDASRYQRELSGRLTKDLDGQTRSVINQHLEPYFAGETIKARHTATKQSVDIAAARLDQGLADLTLSAARAENGDELQRIIDFGNQSIEAQRRAGTISPEQATVRTRAFRDQIYINQIEADLQTSPGEVLKLLEDKENYAELRPDIRNQLILRARSMIEGRKRERLTQLREEVKDAEFALDRGFIPPNLEGLAARVRGTELAADFAVSLEDAGKVSEFALLPPPAQDELLARSAANRRQSGRNVRLLERLGKVRDRQEKALTEDPLQLGVELGLEPAPATLTMDTLDNFTAGLKDRASMANRLEGHFQRTVAPMFKREAQQLARVLEAGDVNQRLSVLGGLNDGLGERSPDALAQLAGEGARQMAYAGGLLREDPEGARLLLTGMKQRQANKGLVPKDADMLIDESVVDLNEALKEAPEARADMLEAVRNIYAGMAAESGNFDGAINSDMLETAVERASGGIIEWDPGLFKQSSKILAPRRGMTSDEFGDWIDGLTADDLTRLGGVRGLDPDVALKAIKKDSQLKTVGPGRYLVQIGIGYLTRADGEPFVLEWVE